VLSTSPTTFRVVFAVLFVLLFGIVGTYRRRAQAGRRFDASPEGRGIFYALRLGGLALWGYCVLYVVFPGALQWSFLPLSPGIRWAGGAMTVAILPWVVAAQRVLGRNVSPTVITHDDHELITTGPYRWVRNPLYVGGAVIFAGLGLLAASWFLVGAAVLSLVLVRVRLPEEEAQLEARFGDAYRDYVRRTGRFLPRWRRGGASDR
jgi:protein-S-isoprenylcysteine O-methyltransferase Ste14